MAVEMRSEQAQEYIILSSEKVFLDPGDGTRHRYIGDMHEAAVSTKVKRFPSSYIKGPGLSTKDGLLAANPDSRTGIYLKEQEKPSAIT